MEVDSDRIQDLIAHPQESLAVELKTWINPDLPDGIAKIVKTVLAIRNYGGGYMVFGFDNNTLKPDLNTVPPDVRKLFHIDRIQGLVAKYASEPFEVTVEYPERDGQEFPVIIIPAGVKTPVAAKSELYSTDGKKVLIQANAVYVRSLSANNTPSTTQATWKDWAGLVEVCFDNREADIARFIRRHLGGLAPEQLRNMAAVLTGHLHPQVSTEDMLREYCRESEQRYELVLQERGITLPNHGSWEVALILLGQVPQHAANRQFLNLLSASNPDYTGWPMWLDSRNFGEDERPYVIDGVWEACLVTLKPGWFSHIDFMRLDPKGKFFQRRALEDDLGISDRAPKPMTTLDFSLPVSRTAEAIAVGIAFAKAMGCEPEETTLAFAFKWTGLKGRHLSSWVNPLRFLIRNDQSYQNDVVAFVNVPLDTSLSALAQYVHQAVQPLFEAFGGFELDITVIEDLTRRLIERRH